MKTVRAILRPVDNRWQAVTDSGRVVCEAPTQLAVLGKFIAKQEKKLDARIYRCPQNGCKVVAFHVP
jgi:hypothetical protein